MTIKRGAARLPSLRGHDLYSRRYSVPDQVYVYAYLDADRRVLYVGLSGDLRGRNAGHHERAAWYPLATEFRVLWSTFDRREGRAAEAKAIRELDPVFNVMHSPSACSGQSVKGTAA